MLCYKKEEGRYNAQRKRNDDVYQDYDVTFFVADIAPFYNNPAWIEAQFGKPLIMQMPEAMRYPTGNGNFSYLMIFPDGNRIDLCFEFKKYIDDGELCHAHAQPNAEMVKHEKSEENEENEENKS